MNQLWRVSDAAAAADIPVETLRRYLDRRQLTLQANDHRTKGSGNHRALSRARIYQAALAYELIKMGVAPARAFSAAELFSDFGDSERQPGTLYACGGTTLILNDAWQKVINANGDATLQQISDHAATTIVVNVKTIVGRVNEILNTRNIFK